MKPVRLLLVLLGLVLVLGAVVLGLALTPSVQRWAVLRMARDAGVELEVARISAGWSGAQVLDAQVEKEGIRVKVDRLDADFSLWRLLAARQLNLSRLKVTGLAVDASRVSRTKAEAAAAGAPAAAPGLLARIELPVDLTLDDASIEGRAQLPGNAGQPPLAAEFTVTGGKFAPGQEGQLQLSATVHDGATGAKVKTLRAKAGLRATLTRQRNLNNVTLTTVVDAEGGGLTGQSQLKVSAELFRTTSGESYTIGVDTVQRGTADNILKVQARLDAASRQYAGEWTLKSSTPQVEPFSLGAPLPDFSLQGGGSFTFDLATKAFHLQGGLRGQVSRWEALEPSWRAFGRIAIDTTFDVGQRGGILDLEQFKATLTGEKPVAEIRTVSAVHYDLNKGQLVANGAGPDKLLEVTLRGVPVDWVRPFISAADISGDAITGQFELDRVAGAATTAAIKGRLQAPGFSVVQNGRPLLMHADISVQGEAIVVERRVDARSLELNVATPAGDSLKLTGKLSAQAGTAPQAEVDGRITATAVQMLARWLPGAPVTAEGDVKFAWRGDEVEISPARMQLRQGADQVLFRATILQPFTVGLNDSTLRPKDASQPVARVELGRLPLGLLPLTEPGTVLGGTVQQGTFELSVQGNTSTIKAVDSLRLADVSLTQDRAPTLTDLAIEARPIIEFSGPGSLKVQSGDLTVRNRAKALLASLKGEAIQTPAQGTQATITFNFEIPAMAGQPVFAGAQAVSAGRASGEVRASVQGGQSQIEARVTLNGLIAAATGQTLPVANVGFRGLIRSNGTISLEAPLLLDNSGRRSDLRFALELSPLAQGYSVDGRLTGQQIELEDMRGVLGVFHRTAAPEEESKPAVVTGVSPHSVAAWARYSGQLALDVKSVTRGKDWAMTGLTGTLAIEPARLALQKLAASFSETSRLAAQFEMRFTGGAMPYRLTGDYSLNDFDTGRLFKAFEPGKAPTVEGLFSVEGKVAGNGETPARALDRIHGEMQLTSRQGVFRGLQRTTNKVSTTSKVVELGASVLGSLLGSEKAAKTAEKVAGLAYFVDQFAQSVGEFNYDLLSVRMARDELLNMTLEDVSLVSPEIRLSGRGDVSYVAGQKLLEQPLKATLNLGVRGKVEQILGKIRQLDGTKDELGYSRAKEPVVIEGTLAKPDPGSYYVRLAASKGLGELLDFGD
ncbi:MAG TPA: AsmA-like C-terminal region-containing protein [Lacunisphaera sp.]|nr:AsmA-like C-terminal region-containing protein [Lacunisphaera sp.]